MRGDYLSIEDKLALLVDSDKLAEITEERDKLFAQVQTLEAKVEDLEGDLNIAREDYSQRQEAILDARDRIQELRALQTYSQQEQTKLVEENRRYRAALERIAALDTFGCASDIARAATDTKASVLDKYHAAGPVRSSVMATSDLDEASTDTKETK